MIGFQANHPANSLLRQHGEKLDDTVFRAAATAMRALRQSVYKLAGDDLLGFDPNVFIQRLIEETGVSHTWDPIPTKVPSFLYRTLHVVLEGQGASDAEREAKRKGRELL